MKLCLGNGPWPLQGAPWGEAVSTRKAFAEQRQRRGSESPAGMTSGMSGQFRAGLAKLEAHVASGSQPPSDDQK